MSGRLARARRRERRAFARELDPHGGVCAGGCGVGCGCAGACGIPACGCGAFRCLYRCPSCEAAGLGDACEHVPAGAARIAAFERARALLVETERYAARLREKPLAGEDRR